MIASTARKYGSQAIPRYMWTATKPLSRPAAVLSSASSGATVRTSIGNGTAKFAAGNEGHDAVDRLGCALARERVLHLGEAHQPRTGEDSIGAIDPRGRTGEAGDEAVELRDASREATPGAAEQLESVVGEQHVVGVGAHPAARARRLIGAVVGARERGIGVREDEELEVIVAERQLLEARERVGQWRGSVDAAQGEGGDTAEGDLGDHA